MPVASRLYTATYALTLLLSAFLLFLVQPMFGKMILPLLGGSPSVWNTAMLFFQALLLAGYAYAHATARWLSIRAQALIHLGLLILFIFVLPIAIPEGWTPPAGADPTLWQLALMTVAAGGPFFVLSGSAPLLQNWFAHSGHSDAHNPYFLYAASNLGSMTALIAYPFIVEPALKVSDQSLGWSYGYGFLIALILCSALLVWKNAPAGTARAEAAASETITWRRRGIWLMLAFVPSSLMLGVTTFVTTDLASVPLLWIVPLALYVGTFIIAFAKRPFPSRFVTIAMQTVLFVLLLTIEICLIPLGKGWLMGLHILLFFFTALMCHHELAAARPHAGHLTQFYLVMSLGGALGGFFNAIIAPNMFVVPAEYAIALALSAFMRFGSERKAGITETLSHVHDKAREGVVPLIHALGLPAFAAIALMSAFSLHMSDQPKMLMTTAVLTLVILPYVMKRRWAFGFCALAILLFHAPGHNLESLLLKDVQRRDRNFFGILKVGDSAHDPVRLLLHGTTIHGVQAVDAQYKDIPLAYYSHSGPLGDVMTLMDKGKEPQRIAALGLGVGATACYGRAGRVFDFYEIDPAVVAVAEDRNLFTYLSDCGGTYDIILGDGRLKIAEKEDGTYDMIFLDVFSSDNIPVHVMTLEAMALYKRKLRENGLIVMNISNHFMDLKPVIAAAGHELELDVMTRYVPGGRLEGSDLPYNGAEFAVLTANSAYVSKLEESGWSAPAIPVGTSVWTDQYSDIVSVLKIFK